MYEIFIFNICAKIQVCIIKNCLHYPFLQQHPHIYTIKNYSHIHHIHIPPLVLVVFVKSIIHNLMLKLEIAFAQSFMAPKNRKMCFNTKITTSYQHYLCFYDFYDFCMTSDPKLFPKYFRHSIFMFCEFLNRIICLKNSKVELMFHFNSWFVYN